MASPITEKPSTRLVVQFSMPVEDITEGELIYEQIKEVLKTINEKVIITSQVTKMLESCCTKPKQEKLPSGMQRYGPENA